MQGYDTRAPLAARLSIYDHQRDRIDLPGEASRLLAGAQGPVVDVGCGLGQYVDRLAGARPELPVLGLDISAAMARHARADIGRLPLRDDSCGAALAMHMLYHVDVAAAATEMRRVVRKGGMVLASTNGARDKQELYDLVGVAAGEPYVDPARAFTLDDQRLADSFDDVTVQRWTRPTVVPALGPLAAFVASMGLPVEVAERTVALLGEHLARTGTFTMTSEIGIFVCR